MIVAFMEPIPGIGSNALSIMEYLPRTPELDRDLLYILHPRGAMVARAEERTDFDLTRVTAIDHGGHLNPQVQQS